MTTVNTYLRFNGNCEEAFNFYKTVFGGEFGHVGRFKEMPPIEGMSPISEADKNKIMHISLPISDETELMGSDIIEDVESKFKKGNNFSISIRVNETEEADKLFAKLSSDGQIIMPMNKTFWGSYFGLFTDKFGVNWMINVDLNQ